MATIQQGSAQNFLGKQSTTKYSNFDLSGHVYTTHRFGEVQPFLCVNGITGDKWKIRNAHKLTTYTLSAPLMNELHMEKDIFLVPRQAILPNSWDKISQQPNIGDDVDATIAGTSVPGETWNNFLKLIETNKNNAGQMMVDTSQGGPAMFAALGNAIKWLIMAEYIYSYGSLANVLGIKMAAAWEQEVTTGQSTRGNEVSNFDGIFEKFWNNIPYGLTIETNDGIQYTLDINLGKGVNAPNKVTLNDFLERIRDDFNWITKKYWTSSTASIDTSTAVNTIKTAFQGMSDVIFDSMNHYAVTSGIDWNRPVDIARLWAYQMVCAEFYSCDKVDYIYSAELFRQYIGSIIATETGDCFDTYNWNGLSIQYDMLSAYYFNENVNSWINLNYFAALFSYKRSLKYRDYFVGSKVAPLAVGNITIGTDAQGNVAVEDVTKGIQAQRFKNAVNRVGRKIDEYAKEFRGVNMAHDYHNPLWLGSTRDVIKPYETENTGEAQITEPNAVTARLESYGGNARFLINLDRDGIIIGLAFYDLERSYAKGLEKAIMHVDRYDMFNEYMQYTGDQALLQVEYDAAKGMGTDGTFGYVPAYEEFKQNTNKAMGGFVTALPGYTFIDGMERNYAEQYRPENDHISPDFIRCRATELDRYYNSLTGHSYANYFHFIIDFYNEIEATRPMSFNPQIL